MTDTFTERGRILDIALNLARDAASDDHTVEIKVWLTDPEAFTALWQSLVIADVPVKLDHVMHRYSREPVLYVGSVIPCHAPVIVYGPAESLSVQQAAEAARAEL